MISRRMLSALAAVLAMAAVAVAAFWISEAGRAEQRLALVREQNDTLSARLAESKSREQRARRRAGEAERDVKELLVAVAAVRRQPTASTAATPPTAYSPDLPGQVRSGQQAEPAPAAAARVDYPQTLVDGQTRTTAVLTAEAGGDDPERQERLRQERAYHQDLAKRRAAAAKAQAEFEIALQPRERAAQFNAWLERAAAFAAQGDFQAAIRSFNQGMAVKPPELPLSDRWRELQVMLRAQNSPTEVTLQSDGLTWVAIRNVKAPAQFTAVTVKILPGDYEVVGRRKGFRDVVVPLIVRGGVVPPVVRVVCTEAVRE